VAAFLSSALLLVLAFGSIIANPESANSLSVLWINFSLSAGIAHSFFTFVLVGYYFSQYRSLGKLGLLAFAIAIVANSTFTATQIMLTFASIQLDPVINFLAGPGMSIGLSLLALANQLSGKAPKPAGWLMAAGHVLNYFAAQSNFDFYIPPTLQILLFVSGIIWVGIWLIRGVSNEPHEVMQAAK
jgi:hypothetical protein